MIRVKIVPSDSGCLTIFISSSFDLIIFAVPLPLTGKELNCFPLGLVWHLQTGWPGTRPCRLFILDFLRMFFNNFMSKQIRKTNPNSAAAE